MVGNERSQFAKSCGPLRSLIRQGSTDQQIKCESDEEDNHNSEFSAENVFEIGPPKIMKYLAENELGDYPCLTTTEANEKTLYKSFYGKELKEYLKGGFICDFCQSKSLAWPPINNHTIYNSLNVNTFLNLFKLLLEIKK